MTYLPKLQTQLNRGTPVPGRTKGSRDCGPRSVAMAVDAATEGQVKLTITQVRARMGVPGPQLSNVDDAKRGVESLRGLRYTRLATVAKLRQAVVSGKPVHLCIDYGTFDRLAGSTGDPNFTGGHSVLVYGQRKANGAVWWRLFDPLDDGRRAGIPTGPRWVKRQHLLAAALDFGGGQAILAGAVGGRHE